MAEGKKRAESILEMPLDKLKYMNGVSMDFGGSVLKVAYLSKEDWKDDKPVSGDRGKVRLISFSREEFDEGLEFLKKNCYMRRKSPEDQPLMFTCGLGGAQYGQKIEDELKIRTSNIFEMVGFQASLEYFVNNVSLEESCVPNDQEAYESGKLGARKQAQLMIGLAEKGLSFMKPKANAMELFDVQHDPSANIKPYLLGIFGSAFGVMEFNEDGGLALVTMSNVGGRSFLGLGSLLTGAKSYYELMDLAEKGTNLSLDETTDNLTKKTEHSKDGGDDLYHNIKDMVPRPLFLWAKGIGKNLSEFKKEDIARTLLYSICQIVSTTIIDACLITRTRHIFASGSFLSHPLTRRLVMEDFEFRKWSNAAFLKNVDANYHLHILKHGSHLGAIGAFLSQLDKGE